MSSSLSSPFSYLFIVNKSGGLIHHRGLTPSAQTAASQIGTNEWLRIASTFHSLHAIAAEASPKVVRLSSSLSWGGKNATGADDGIEEIRAGGIILTCLQTITGIKFVITTNPNNNITVDVKEVLKEVYVLYTECVLKDPFYELEMPIRSDLFVQAVDATIQRFSKGMSYTSNTSRR